MIIGLPLWGQSFIYSYIDPCTKQSKFINADMSAPIVISYYGQVKAFTYAELSNGVFDAWINDIYNKYKSTSPCQGVLTTTTTTTSTNQVSNIIGNVTNILGIDLSSVTGGVTGGVGNNIGGTTSSGSGSISTDKKNGNNGNNNSSNPNSSGNTGSGSNSSEGQTGQTGQTGGNSSENQGGSVGSNQESGGSVGGNNNSGNSSNSSSGSNGSGSGSGNSGEGQPQEKPTDKQIEDQKVETQKTSTQSSAKAAAKAKAETQKPAILMTGDIVGVQTKSDGSQDARGTMSFTRVKGDGTASIGFSADYMVNAKIGNLSAVRSWIGTKKKGRGMASASISDGKRKYKSVTIFFEDGTITTFEEESFPNFFMKDCFYKPFNVFRMKFAYVSPPFATSHISPPIISKSCSRPSSIIGAGKVSSSTWFMLSN